MWFDILPSFTIVCAALALPHGLAYVINRLVVDNSFRRSLMTHEERMLYLRDTRLVDDPYKVVFDVPDGDFEIGGNGDNAESEGSGNGVIAQGEECVCDEAVSRVEAPLASECEEGVHT